MAQNSTEWFFSLPTARARQVRKAARVLIVCGFSIGDALDLLYSKSREGRESERVRGLVYSR